MRYFNFLLFSLFLVFSSCDKDSSIEPTTTITSTLSGEMVTANFYGQLSNDQGDAVQGAEVHIGNRQTTTDQEGLWKVENATVVEDQAFIQFSATDHHKGSRTLLVTDGNTYEVDVEMLAFTGNVSIVAAAGGTATVAGTNASVTFPAGAFAKTDGTPYTGTVRVEAAYLDPNSPTLGDRMPGDLRATTTEGDSRMLISYGMMSVELFDDAGNELQLADGQLATLTMPIAGDAANTAPETIPLWYFDEATAQWIEEGSATLLNGSYVGEVSHFTFWNCDVPTDFVKLCGTVVFEGIDSTIAANLRLIIESTNWGAASGFTDENGQFCGLVPANETLTLIVNSICNQPAFSISIGPFSADSDIGTIIVPNRQRTLINVAGSTSCDGSPIQAGAVRIFQNGILVKRLAIDPNGTFNTEFLVCDTSEIRVQVVNYVTLESGEETFPFSNTISTGIIEACSSIQVYFFRLTFDGDTIVGDECTYAVSPYEFAIRGHYAGPNGISSVVYFELMDTSLAEVMLPGMYTAPPFDTSWFGFGPYLSLSGFPNFQNSQYAAGEMPYEITAFGTPNSPYTTGRIGPGIVQLKDSLGTSSGFHTVEIEFSADKFQ